MSLPSASGDERYGDSNPSRNGAGPSSMPFMGGLPHPRSNSELHQDSTPGDTPSSLSLPGVDEKQYGNRESKTELAVTVEADSKPSRIAPDQKVDIPGEEKQPVDSEDEKKYIIDSSEDDSEYDSEEEFTVFDAVAGRLGYDGLVQEEQQPIAASDYLFRNQQGPEQDESYENFTAHRHLKHRLPDSDLLKAIHTHASDFYGALSDAEDSFESMDETALIAMGILLEEATAEALGETGDLAFTEAARPGEAVIPNSPGRRIKRQKIKHEGDVKMEPGVKLEPGIKEESRSSDDESFVDDRGRSPGLKRRRKPPAGESGISTEEETERTEEDPSHNSDVETWLSQTMNDSQEQPGSELGMPSDLPIR